MINVHGQNLKDGPYVLVSRVYEGDKALLYHIEIGYHLLPKEVVNDYLDQDYEQLHNREASREYS